MATLTQNLDALAVPHAVSFPGCHAASSKSTAGCPVSCSVWSVRAGQSSPTHVSPDPLLDRKMIREKLLGKFFSDPFHIASDPIYGRKMMREKLWRDFFSDPSQWWDNRLEKVNPRYPDFKHKSTGQSLWLVDRLTPPWVKAELVTMVPGFLQSQIFSWNVRLKRYLDAKHYKKTVDLFQQMLREGMTPDKFTFMAVLTACSNLRSLEEGRRVHKQIIQRGGEPDIYLATCLIDMYAKCGSIEDAWIVFNKMRDRDVVSWSAMIVGYVKSEQALKALELFRIMQQEGVEPNTVTFVGALNACANIVALEEGRCLHKQIIQKGCGSDIYVSSSLVDMYAKCGSISDAWSVFKTMPKRNVISWNAMIGGYVKSEQGLEALELFQKMQQEGLEPNKVTFLGALNACALTVALEEGKQVHEQVIHRGCEADLCVANCLVDMYAKCGSIEDAWSVFKRIAERSVVSWNSIIGGYVKSEQGLKALELFQKMQQEGVEPDKITFVGVLNACASIAALDEGRRVHEQIIRRGCESDVYVATCLVDMYAKCRSIEDAWSVFDNIRERDVVSWTAMIVGYAKSKQGLKALELYRKMQQEGVKPNTVTFVGALNACAVIAALEEGRCVHEQIIQRGYDCNIYVANCLVDMYAKCGSIDDARSVFNGMQECDVVSWNVMIRGYVKAKQGLKALKLFQKMQQEGMEPNNVTFIGVLNACASMAAFQEGRRVHKQIIRRGCQSDVSVANCLVDMYAKSGSIKDARSVFNKMQERDVVSWSTMIGGYAIHGHAKKAIELFELMGKEGIKIDQITFTSLLSACSHGGLVQEGLSYFNAMTSRYNVVATREHYVCVVDLLGRAGCLEEAEEMLKRIPMKRDSFLWMALLSACRIHGNIKIAERAAKKCWELEPEKASSHVLLSNIYAAFGKLERRAAIEEDTLKKDVWKETGPTWIEVNNVVHLFLVDDEQHPQFLEIHAKLENLSVQMYEEGYIPYTRVLSHDERKESNLCRHSEKLAIGDGSSICPW